MNKPIIAALLLSGLISGPQAMSQSVAPDNAKSNKTNSSNVTATADAQSNNAADLYLTKRIRRSIIADKSLSTYAHNVKIVTVNGSVTLNGVVRSEAEKSAIEAKAVEVAGPNKVTDDLKVAPSNQ